MRIILTDFTSPRWNNTDMDKVRAALADLAEQREGLGTLYGEFEHPEDFNIGMARVSHTIDNIELKDDVVTGDVNVLRTKAGNSIREDFEQGKYRMGIRAAGTVQDDGQIVLKQIFTWDIIKN